GTFAADSSLPPRGSRNVRSETFWTSTPGSSSRASETSWAWATSRVSALTSMMTVCGVDSTTSSPVTPAPVAAAAATRSEVADWPTAMLTRRVIEYPGLVATMSNILPDIGFPYYG